MNTLNKQNPLIWAAILSFLLSIALSFYDVLNSDGILYLRVSREFLQHHYSQGLAMYSWPFYSLLIALFSQVTSLSLELSATVINAGLMALMTSGFVALVRELGGSRTIQWIGAFIFLVHPGINYFREYVIRDFGAWAMLLWSIVFLCRFSQQRDWLNVLGWTLTTLIGVLFRPELILWLLLGPMALLTSMTALPFKKRWQALFQCNSVYFVLILLVFVAAVILQIDLPPNKLAKMTVANLQVFSSGFTLYTQKAQAFSEQMSIFFEYDDALVVLGFALLFYFGLMLIKLISPLYLFLLGYAAYHRPLITKPEARIVLWMIMIYTCIYILFLVRQYFLDARYLIPWVAGILVWVPFALARFWPAASKAGKAIVCVFFIYMMIDSFVSFGYSKLYLKDAGQWINLHTSDQTRLYTNSMHVEYYADRPLVSDEKNAQIIALRYTRKTPEIHEEIKALSHYRQVDFHNKREDGVRVIVVLPDTP